MNRLIGTLPARTRRQLLENCRPVELVFAEVLAEPGDRIREVYFPTSGFISLVDALDEHASLEVALVGDEGMLGTSLALGVDISPLRALVQGAGWALRMDAEQFRDVFQKSEPLQHLLQNYLYVVMGQVARNAGCVHFHLVEARLARWLLMMNDRAHSDRLYATHEFMANMLGVRRAGVTRAATILQTRELIRYRRGCIDILDRAELERTSCGCYAADNTLYARVMS
ncbi:Crp/Fnr family transcriptional regulator [Niveibacterium sp. SC-1]|uniref:Crp/Fnr family transcriptional regulator n=1 Tax=Niveibacterium sp. SC-1 TaxID=3135646 RepID=UPI00311D7581